MHKPDNKELTNSLIVYGLILIGIASRLLPHPANFAPISTLALFSGAYLSKKYSIIIPLTAMIISDVFLGFHPTMPYVYGSFILIALLGQYLKNRSSAKNILALSLSGSFLFFVITNFGVWLSSGMYEHTVSGFVRCYTLAIPFYRNTLAGDLTYTAVFFGAYVLVNYLTRQTAAKAQITKSF